MKIDTSRFEFAASQKGRKRHIFPKEQSKALCLFDVVKTYGNTVEKYPVCKICEKEYPVVSSSPIFRIFIG